MSLKIRFLFVVGVLIFAVASGNQDRTLQRKKLGECKASCNRDVDCAKGLKCAKNHKKQLRSFGLDPSKAYCKKGPNSKPKRNVCYDPKKLVHQTPGLAPTPAPTQEPGGREFCKVYNTETGQYPTTGDVCNPLIDPESCTIDRQVCCPVTEKLDDNGNVICGGDQCMYVEGCNCDSTEKQWFCYMASVMCPDPNICFE